MTRSRFTLLLCCVMFVSSTAGAAPDVDPEPAAKDADDELGKLNPKIFSAILEFEKQKAVRIEQLQKKGAARSKLEKVLEERWAGEPATIPLKSGMVGGFFNVTVCCTQAVDDRNFIGWIRDNQVTTAFAQQRPPDVRQTVWFKGYDTTEMSDGAAVQLTGVFIVSGTKRYDTAVGGTKQLMVIERFDLGPYYNLLKKQGAIAELPAKKSGAKKDEPAAKPDAKSAEDEASAKLALAKQLMKQSPDNAQKRLKELIEKYPDTAAAAAARDLLKK